MRTDVGGETNVLQTRSSPVIRISAPASGRRTGNSRAAGIPGKGAGQPGGGTGGKVRATTGRVASRRCAAFVFLACLCVARVGLGATPLELDVTISNAVDAQFSFATGANSNKPGGVVGVALDGDLVFQRAYGMADVGGQVRNSITAPFYLASCSKQFTAMSVLLCQEKGLLAITNGVRQYIPELHTN